MKKVLYVLLFILFTQVVFAQSIEETAKEFWSAVHENQHEKIIQNREILLEHIEKNNFILDTTVVEIRLNTAKSYESIGVYKKALDLNLETYNLLKSNWGDKNQYTTIALNNSALSYAYMGNYDKAIDLNLQAIEVYKNTVGENHHIYAISLYNTASNFANIGIYDKALELNKKALEIIEKIFEKTHPDYSLILNNLTSNYAQIGDYSKAIELSIQSLEIKEKTLGKNHPEYTLNLNNLASYYNDIGDFNKALEINIEVLGVYEQTLGKNHSTYATSLNNIAQNHTNIGNYKKAIEYNLQALGINEMALGKMHPNYAMSLNNIAMDYSHMGVYTKSIEYNLQALEIFERTLGKEHPDYARSMCNLALNYSQIGSHENSLKLNLQALEIKEKTLGKTHPDYALSLNNIAMNYNELGFYTKAIEYNLQTIAILKKNFGVNNHFYAIGLNNIASNYAKLGDYEKSIELNLLTLEIREKTLGRDHPDYATSLNNIALNYENIGKYEKAIEFNLQALDVREKTLGKNHPEYAKSINNLASNYSKTGNYTIAIELSLQAIEIYERTQGRKNPEYATFLNNVALNYANTKQYDKAINFTLQALEIYKGTVGRNHPDFATSLDNLTAFFTATNQLNKASTHISEAHTIREYSFNQNKFGLHSSLLETNKKSLEHSFKLIGGLLYRDSSISQFVGQSWLNLNGVISSNQQHLEREILSSGDTSMVRLMEELKLSKLQLSKYQELTIQEKQERGIDEEELENQINSYERQLSAKSQSFADFNRYFSPSDVSNVLEHNECFVDIARVPYYSFYSNDWTDSVNYIVFVHTPTDTLIDYFFIRNGNALEYDVIDNYADFTSGEYKTIDVKDNISYENFWKPIAARIGSATTVYVSAGGIYNNINLNTLFNPETDNYLLHEKDIRMVNSARDFVLMKERDNQDYRTNTVALFGYPNYDGSTITKTIDTLDYLSMVRDLPLGLDSLTRGGMKASLLPGTKTEVKNISSTFTKNKWNTSIFIGNEASEESIKQLTSPRVLHIATHGYFFEDVQVDFKQDRFMGMDRKQVIDNPLLRSGLLLSGANQTLQGEEVNSENGLLSAYEASLLDLRKTELVVLSACETGKGEVKNSEGVYGLRKAFADAGAKNIIMSLWKVDDAVTQEFMTLFYEIWLNDKTSIREAFNRTQLEIKAKYPQPYYWGAFILVGG
jgi:tetratricopeptide (TPR) repeat protein